MEGTETITLVVNPQCNCLSMMLPKIISDLIFKQYNKIISDLWDKKKPSIKMSKTSVSRDRGGLCLLDVNIYKLSFEMTKLARY